MDMMIVAEPTNNIVVLITEETPEFDAKMVTSKTIFKEDLDTTVEKFLKEYIIDTMSIYGPLDYIEKIAKDLKNSFHYKVNVIGV